MLPSSVAKKVPQTSSNYHHKNNCPGLHIWCFAILHNKLSKTETRECWWEKGQEKVTQIVVEASHSTPPIACLLFTNSFSLSLVAMFSFKLFCFGVRISGLFDQYLQTLSIVDVKSTYKEFVDPRDWVFKLSWVFLTTKIKILVKLHPAQFW